MNAAFSIILPHKRNPGNNRALALCLDMLQANTRHDFILLMDAADDQPLYPRINRLFAHAPTDCCVYWASDMFPSPGWDVPMLAAFQEDTIVCNTVVEPGVISMYAGNHRHDFGRTPDTFQRGEYENWCLNGGHVAGGDPWFVPYMVSRRAFQEMGCLDTEYDKGYEFGGADMKFFNDWKAAGRKVVRAKNSWAYHLQRFSDVGEQEAAKRR